MSDVLKTLPLNEAKRIFQLGLPDFLPQVEKISILKSLGRVLAMPVFSSVYLPPFSRSAMDGFALRAVETQRSSEKLPVTLKITGEVPMGSQAKFSLKPGQAALIHTGGMIPEGADAVVILENTNKLDGGRVEIVKPVSAGDNVLFKGEDVKPGDLLIRKGSRIRVEEIAGLLALGMTEVKVNKLPIIAILSSGDEIVPPGEVLQPGQVYDINTGALSAFVLKNGGIPVTYPLIRDDLSHFNETARKAFREADTLVFTAGSSASSRDITAAIIGSLGAPGVLVHGIAVRPGKPSILAVCDGKPVIGLPGNPVSALVIARLFLAPLIYRLTGLMQAVIDPVIHGFLTKSVQSDIFKDEFIPVLLNQIADHYEVEPIFYKSNLIFNLEKANGLLHIPAGTTGFKTGDEVEILLLD